MTSDILSEISGGDLDEMIDFQNAKPRYLQHFNRNFLELVMHCYTILNGGDLVENGNSKDWKLIIHGYKKLFKTCTKAILTKITI